MDGAAKVFRSTPMKVGAALIVIAVLSIGVAACGSGSSTDSTQSVSDVPKKEAGIGRDVRLNVVNQGQDTVTLQSCVSPGNCRTGDLQPGESISMVADQVTGSIRYQNGDRVDFDADSPAIGQPSIQLSSPDDPSSGESLRLSEGEQQTVSFRGHDFRASRSADTDYKELRLEVVG